MTKFRKPLKQFKAGDPEYPEYAKVAVQRALEDCEIKYNQIEFATVGSCFSTGNGQRCLYEMGMTGIPIFNVANACATGSNALYLSRQMVASGQHECALALGIEIMKPGPLGSADATASSKGPRRVNGMDHHVSTMMTKFPIARAPQSQNTDAVAQTADEGTGGSRWTVFVLRCGDLRTNSSGTRKPQR